MTANTGLVLGTAVFAATLTASACSSAPAAAPPPAAAQQKLWGDMKPVVSVKELMRDMIDPASDYVFDAIGSVDTKNGTVEKLPTTDADWERLRAGGVMLAEGAYLLKVPRPFAPEGDVNNSTGPDPEELSPTQILAKLEKDPVLWNAKIEALRNVGLQVMDIVKRRDAKELWDASDNLDNACESCHVAFWYPVEGEFLKRLDKHLADLAKERELHPDRTRTPAPQPPK
jgi:hypothetical protein